MRIVWSGICVVLALAACSKEKAPARGASAGGRDSAVVAGEGSSPPVVLAASGVRFDPPPSWTSDRYRVEEKSGAAAAAEQPGAAFWVAMHYRPDQPGHSESSLCRIVVFARAEWARVGARSGAPIGTLIEALERWVYVAQLPQWNPYPEGSLDGDQFESMRLTIRDVRDRFSVQGAGPDLTKASDAGES